MNEISKYGVLKEKLQGICDENDLVYSIQNQGYPFRLTIKPAGGLDAQQTMMEGMDTPSDTGYISPDAALVFAFRDGDLTYKISETWTISENLFNKLKNLFKKMHSMWMQYFYRDIHEHSPGAAARSEEAPQEEEEEDPDVSVIPDIEDDADIFNDFLDEAEDATEESPEDDEGEK